jgi:indole-3-glycerol phosphate synthase
MNILTDIVRHKRQEVARRKRSIPLSRLQDGEFFHRKTLSLRDALTARGGAFSIIAELKRSSPAAGMIRKGDLEGIALDYQRNGAAAISVLTDKHFFSGSLRDLARVRKAVSVPLLRKDFLIDEYQLAEAKAHGADAVLLVATILGKTRLAELHEAARELGLESLVEIYDATEIPWLDHSRMELVGINNRDLKTFIVDLERSAAIRKLLPGSAIVVSESGIKTGQDLLRLKEAGIHSALVGEALMRAEAPGSALSAMLRGVGA